MTELVTRYRCSCGFTDYISHRMWEKEGIFGFKWANRKNINCPKCKAEFDAGKYNQTVVEGMLIVGKEKPA